MNRLRETLTQMGCFSTKLPSGDFSPTQERDRAGLGVAPDGRTEGAFPDCQRAVCIVLRNPVAAMLPRWPLLENGFPAEVFKALFS